MSSKRCWWVVAAVLAGCGSSTEDPVEHDGAADATSKDALAADAAFDVAEVPGSPDTAREIGPGDLQADLQQDRAPDFGGIDSHTVVDAASGPDARPDGGPSDAASAEAAPETAGEAAAPPSYVCRDDSDCCIKVDTCMAKAYLYSKAPGASPAPTIPTVTDPGQCLRCITPGVQVRCDNGQCVGQQVSGRSDLAKSHCGTIPSPDGGSAPASAYSPAYAGGQQAVWGC